MSKETAPDYGPQKRPASVKQIAAQQRFIANEIASGSRSEADNTASTHAQQEQGMSKLKKAAVAAIKHLAEAGQHAFITGESCGPEQRYLVTAKFRTLEQAQDFRQALVDCSNVAQDIARKEKSKAKDSDRKEGAACG